MGNFIKEQIARGTARPTSKQSGRSKILLLLLLLFAHHYYQTKHIPNPAFSLPSHNLDKGAESSTHITDPASSLDSHELGRDSACIPSTGKQTCLIPIGSGDSCIPYLTTCYDAINWPKASA